MVEEHCGHLGAEHNVWYSILLSVAVHAGLIAILILFGTCGYSMPDRISITRTPRLGIIKPPDHLPDKLIAVVRPPPPASRHHDNAGTNDKKRPPKIIKSERRTDYSKEMEQAISRLTQDGGRTKTDEKPDGFPDGSQHGDATIKQAGNNYVTGIERIIQANYSVPDLIPARERLFLQAVVAVRINSDGSLIDVTFKTRSGNPLFDDAVETTIRRAAPFPAPPLDKVSNYSESGIQFKFDAKTRH